MSGGSGHRAVSATADTEKMHRIVTEAVAGALDRIPPTPPPPHKCDQEGRITKLEAKVEAHDAALNKGEVTFAEIRKDIHTLTESVKSLTKVVAWVGFGVVGTVGFAVINLVLKSPVTPP